MPIVEEEYKIASGKVFMFLKTNKPISFSLHTALAIAIHASRYNLILKLKACTTESLLTLPTVTLLTT